VVREDLANLSAPSLPDCGGRVASEAPCFLDDHTSCRYWPRYRCRLPTLIEGLELSGAARQIRKILKNCAEADLSVMSGSITETVIECDTSPRRSPAYPIWPPIGAAWSE